MRVERNHINLFLKHQKKKKNEEFCLKKPEEEENLTKHARNLRLEIFLSLVFTIVTIFSIITFKTKQKEKLFNKTNKFISRALV